MPAAPRRRPGNKPADSVPTWLPPLVVAIAVLVAASSCGVPEAGESVVGNTTTTASSRGKTDPERPGSDVPGRVYELVSTSESQQVQHDVSKSAADVIPSSELSAATKQYDYSLLRPLGPIIAAYPGRPASSGWPSVEILSHHRDPPFVTHKPSQHLIGSPLLSTVVVQDMSQSVVPRPPIAMDSGDVHDVHHLGPGKIPLTDVKVTRQPLYGGGSHPADPSFTDKLEESALVGDDESAEAGSDDDVELLENPPHLDVGGIVEDALRDAFKDEKVVKTMKVEVPKRSWPCAPITCCARPTRASRRKCSTVVKCSAGQRPQCPTGLPTPQALSAAPPNDTSKASEKTDVRDGEPRFKKKKIIKKKKKFLKKFMLPLLLAYKLLFLLVLPLLTNGMMMMMSSSGMAGFFFALIGASVAMVRVYTGSMRVIPEPTPQKVVKVVKYVHPAPLPPPPPVQPSVQPTLPPPSPTTTTPSPPIVHHQPFVEDHFPPYHAPPAPPPLPPYGTYYPHPYMTRYYDRSGAFEGGRRKRRRRKDSLLLNNYDFDRTLANYSHYLPDYWLSE